MTIFAFKGSRAIPNLGPIKGNLNKKGHNGDERERDGNDTSEKHVNMKRRNARSHSVALKTCIVKDTFKPDQKAIASRTNGS